jgi:hypothetical protein
MRRTYERVMVPACRKLSGGPLPARQKLSVDVKRPTRKPSAV